MPFTPTHIVAVLPIAAVTRGALPLSALAIGSMIPDVPLFLSIAPDYDTTHSVPGLFTACLPMGTAAFVAYRWFLKRPLLALLPDAVRRRCGALAAPDPLPSPGDLLAIGAAIVLGAFTHMTWDAFTHEGRWGTLHVPWLESEVMMPWGRLMPGYKVAQYGCSAVGLPLLAALVAAWLTRQDPGSVDGQAMVPGWSKGIVWAGTPAVVGGVAWWAWSSSDGSRYHRLHEAITWSGLALSGVVLAYALAFHALGIVKARMTGAGTDAAWPPTP